MTLKTQLTGITLPLVNVQLNPLDAALYILGKRFALLYQQQDTAFLALTTRAFHNDATNDTTSTHVPQKIIQFVSDDGIFRHFIFTPNGFAQAIGELPADLTIRAKNSHHAARLLFSGKKAVLRALQTNDLTLMGDDKLLLWLLQLGMRAKTLPQLPQTVQPIADKILPAVAPLLKPLKPAANKALRLSKKWLG